MNKPNISMDVLKIHAVDPVPRSLIARVREYPGARISEMVMPKRKTAAPRKMSMLESAFF